MTLKHTALHQISYYHEEWIVSCQYHSCTHQTELHRLLPVWCNRHNSALTSQVFRSQGNNVLFRAHMSCFGDVSKKSVIVIYLTTLLAVYLGIKELLVETER